MAFPAVAIEGQTFIAADGSAQHPSDPDTRVAAFSVIWRSGAGNRSVARQLGF